MTKNTKSVLFIDDDKATNFLNERIARNYGCFNKVVTVQSGIQGLQYLTTCHSDINKKPDLIFLDINMPAMNGWEFLDEFYKMPETFTRGIKIVILSTSSEPKDIDKFNKNKKLLDYINKPINLDVLNNVMRKFSDVTKSNIGFG
ncbi:response regulator [uncultured Dokdonia sp.]|uniref:response regulator n=1 Tax=uncultured Dokdonia sp. TaxID=575653 RepID=UPI002637267A|nr:response regulator [uncultured Dokdonia sp.]